MATITIHMPEGTPLSEAREIERGILAYAERTGKRVLRKDRVIGAGIEYDLQRVYKPNPESNVIQLPVRGQRHPHAPQPSPAA